MSILGRPFPQAAIKQRKGRGQIQLDYLQGHTVIHRLNEATGGAWDFYIDPNTEIIDIGGEAILKVRVTLSIPGLGSRDAIGIQSLAHADKGGEDILKGAQTDGLKKAATMFGVGLQLYGADFERDAAKATLVRLMNDQPTMKEDMASWLREKLAGRTLEEVTTVELNRIISEHRVAFPRVKTVTPS